MNKIKSWLWFDVKEATSTNDLAINFVKKHKAPCLFTALRQQNGRGRRGRSWISEEGNLFLSLSVEAELKDLGQLVILSGLAVWQTIHVFCPEALIEVKWPNDVFAQGAKISGILFEHGIDNWWIMGVGINVVSVPMVETMYKTQSLKSLGAKVDRIGVLERFVEVFDQLYRTWQEQGFEKIRQSWLDKAYKRGKKIIIKQDQEIKEGIFIEIDDNGSLILETDQGLEKIIVGDVY